MESNSLEHIIRELIRYEGQITFERFMRLALYHPVLGYYRKPWYPVGKDGDYVTAPELSPAFGKCMARAVERCWIDMGRPTQFNIVEFGSGKGTLAVSLMGYLSEAVPHLYNAATYTLIEQHLGARSRFQPGKYLNDDKFKSVTLDTLVQSPVCGCMISNEFFDAFSVHRLTVQEGLLREVYVGCGKNGEFAEMLGRPIYPAEPFWLAHGVALQDGQQAEVSVHAAETFKRMAVALQSGFIITVDYGDDADKLYTPERFSGTVMTYKNHAVDTAYYADIGSKDITAQVNFSLLKNLGKELGLKESAFTTQQRFLMEHGVLDFSPRDEDLAAHNDRLAWRRLIGFGSGFGEGFKVLVQQKGTSSSSLSSS